MPWYHYRQNNSGGSFSDPAIHVIVEASSADEADDRAQYHGVYFNGVADGLDCGCCGDRWSLAWGSGDPEPMVYGQPVEEFMAKQDSKRPDKFLYGDDGETVLIVPLVGEPMSLPKK